MPSPERVYEAMMMLQKMAEEEEEMMNLNKRNMETPPSPTPTEIAKVDDEEEVVNSNKRKMVPPSPAAAKQPSPVKKCKMDKPLRITLKNLTKIPSAIKKELSCVIDDMFEYYGEDEVYMQGYDTKVPTPHPEYLQHFMNRCTKKYIELHELKQKITASQKTWVSFFNEIASLIEI